MGEDKLHLLSELNGVTVDELLKWATVVGWHRAFI